MRKIRFAPASRASGKSGATRVCYLYVPDKEIVFLITMFAKNEKANLSADEKAAFRKLIAIIKSGLTE